jgi:O-acetyl-ADP-ribose deacetylase (regulator of RNase III)
METQLVLLNMLEFTTGNLLNANTEALVNTVNCVGVAGRGIALAFREAFPENFQAYVQACKRMELQPGQMQVFRTGHLSHPKFIINFPTKRHWKGKSRLEDIEMGLVALVKQVQALQIKSIAIPPLGCGLGGLEWAVVRPLIEQAFAGLSEVQVLIFEPTETIVPNPSREVPKMTNGRAALIGLMNRYLAGLLDPFVSLLEVHKLMYFLQEAGEDLRLRYVKAPYGPYAENLRHVLKTMDGHFLTGYGDGGDQPNKPLELVPGTLQDAMRMLEQHTQTHTRFARVSNLVEGFETPFGLELLSTVHWVVQYENAVHLEQVIEQVYAWNNKKTKFSNRQIETAWLVLKQQNWFRPSTTLTHAP